QARSLEGTVKQIDDLVLAVLEGRIADRRQRQLAIGNVVGNAEERPAIGREIGRRTENPGGGAKAPAMHGEGRNDQSVAGVVDATPGLEIADRSTVISVLWLWILEATVHHDVFRPYGMLVEDPALRRHDLMHATELDPGRLVHAGHHLRR